MFRSLIAEHPIAPLSDETAVAPAPIRSVLVWFQSNLSSQLASQALGAYGPSAYQTLASDYVSFLPHVTLENNDAASTLYRHQLLSSPRSTFTVTADTTCENVVSFVRNSLGSVESRSYIQISSPDLAGLRLLNHCLGQLHQTFGDSLTIDEYLIILQGAGFFNAQTFVQQPQQTIATQADNAQQEEDSSSKDASTTPPANDVDPGQDEHIPPVFPDVVPITPATTAAVIVSGPQYITSGTLTIIGFTILILSFTFFGFLQMLDVEGPLRYPYASHLPATTREY